MILRFPDGATSVDSKTFWKLLPYYDGRHYFCLFMYTLPCKAWINVKLLYDNTTSKPFPLLQPFITVLILKPLDSWTSFFDIYLLSKIRVAPSLFVELYLCCFPSFDFSCMCLLPTHHHHQKCHNPSRDLMAAVYAVLHLRTSALPTSCWTTLAISTLFDSPFFYHQGYTIRNA